MIIAICGGSCSGKTTLAMQFKDACVVSMDNFYLGKEKMTPPYNFDCPDALDLQMMTEVVKKLKDGAKTVTIPKYNMKTSQRDGTEELHSKNIIVVEGIFSLHNKELRELADLKIYLDVPREERIRRRIKRDTIKGRTALESLEWSINVERMHELYVEPQKEFADVCISVK